MVPAPGRPVVACEVQDRYRAAGPAALERAIRAYRATLRGLRARAAEATIRDLTVRPRPRNPPVECTVA